MSGIQPLKLRPCIVGACVGSVGLGSMVVVVVVTVSVAAVGVVEVVHLLVRSESVSSVMNIDADSKTNSVVDVSFLVSLAGKSVGFGGSSGTEKDVAIK